MDNTKIMEGLNQVEEYFNRLLFAAKLDHIEEAEQIEYLKNNIQNGIILINEQENIIKALMGDYGDSCGINGCEGVIND